MKSLNDMITDIFNVININDVETMIDGVIIKHRRPKSSVKTDVVVNGLAISNDALQQGISNINIHAPNLENVVFNNIPDDQYPSEAKIEAIGKIIEPLINGVSYEDYSLFIDEPLTITQDADGSWFGNIRVSYQSFQNNFKNI